MMWPTVVKMMVERMDSDPLMLSDTHLGGPHIYPSRTNIVPQVPSIVWILVDEHVHESTSKVRIQWDIWTNTIEQAANIETRMYALMHRDLHVEIDGHRLWMRHVEYGDLFNNRADLPEEAQDVIHRAVDYEYIIGRSDIRSALFL